jgi:hypothetical protein
VHVPVGTLAQRRQQLLEDLRSARLAARDHLRRRRRVTSEDVLWRRRERGARVLQRLAAAARTKQEDDVMPVREADVGLQLRFRVGGRSMRSFSGAVSFASRASAIRWATSLCTANTSCISRSYVSAHRCCSVEASMSWPVDEERLDLAAQALIAAAGLTRERPARLRRALQRGAQKLLDALPVVVGHKSGFPGRRRAHFQGRSCNSAIQMLPAISDMLNTTLSRAAAKPRLLCPTPAMESRALCA